jgi:hypothetical protein
MTDDDARRLIHEARLKYRPPTTDAGTLTYRERVPARRRDELDAWVHDEGGEIVVHEGDECYLLPLTVEIDGSDAV